MELAELLAVAYTAKTSNASSPEEFINDYLKISKLISEELNSADEESSNDWIF